jgi:hypothetical protein
MYTQGQTDACPLAVISTFDFSHNLSLLHRFQPLRPLYTLSIPSNPACPDLTSLTAPAWNMHDNGPPSQKQKRAPRFVFTTAPYRPTS